MSRYVKIIGCVLILYQLIVLITYYNKSVTLHKQYSLDQFTDVIDKQETIPKATVLQKNYINSQRKIIGNASPAKQNKHNGVKEDRKKAKRQPPLKVKMGQKKTKRQPQKAKMGKKIAKHQPQKAKMGQKKAKRQPTLRPDILSVIPVHGSSVYQRKKDGVLTSRTDMGIKCEPLISQDQDETQRIESTLKDYDKIPLSPEFYINVTTSCDKYIQSRGFITEVTQEERDFPIAFGILMHEEIELLERLLRAIYRPSNFYFVHVDAKAPKSLLKAVSDITNCFDNVHVTSRVVKVTWGQYSVFQADLNCMDDALKFDWKYYINLAGSEFPLKTNLEMVTILKAFNGASSITGGPFRPQMWKNRMSKVGNITGFAVMKGSQHIVANRKFIEFLRTAPEALEFAERLKPALHPHETFYNSIYFSKHLKIPGSYNGTATMISENDGMARYKLWSSHRKSCSGKFVHDICIFGIKELSLLTKAPHLFCNKFHDDFMPIVLDCLESWLFDKIEQETKTGKVQVNTTYYSNLDFVKNQIRYFISIF